MEAKLLAGVVQTDTHKRVQVSDDLLDWMRNEEHDPEAFPDLDQLVGGLAQWMGSSNFKVWGGGRGERGGSRNGREGVYYLE